MLFAAVNVAAAQDPEVSYAIQKIDSLIQYKQFDIAGREADSLYEIYTTPGTRNKYRAELLELKFRQAMIIDDQNGSSAEVLEILLPLADDAAAAHKPELQFRIYLLMALAYEKTDAGSGHLSLTKEYLDKAYNIFKEYKIERYYSTYCIRRSSYCRFINEEDSCIMYAKVAQDYAVKYGNRRDLSDSYILLGFAAYNRKDYESALEYGFQLLDHAREIRDTMHMGIHFNNIAGNCVKTHDYKRALLYSDSAYAFYESAPLLYRNSFGKVRYRLFEALGNTDSAYYYFRQYHNDLLSLLSEDEKIRTTQLEERYQNHKNAATIRIKNQQMIFIASLLGVVVLASLLIIRKNRKINRQNRIISRQLAELSKTLEQKQILLSELQHRVKNNLQHVISILEIQKESVDFNNIDELIRGNQNRIHSMALLHKKLSASDNVNEVDFGKYIAELAELVKESYDHHERKVRLTVQSDVDRLSIEKALPLGLIVTELVSNSMKHAFRGTKTGLIYIEIRKTKTGYRLSYADNGRGFDFYTSSDRGLGVEIIKGLTGQLGGTVTAQGNSGFELSIDFN